ncbi:type II restriction endonuclease [Patescibacteria group bacterium]|nr:type II restriction endonuclease [Patescibacteria group bacterium]
MKSLSLYKDKLNLKGEDDIFNYLLETITKSITTWSFYVDWKKISSYVTKHEEELNLLNTLIGKKNSGEKFIKLIKKYPSIKTVLPLLIAIRISKLKELEICKIKSIEDSSRELKASYFTSNSLNKKDKKELIHFYKESGLKSIIENKNIKNFVDYYTGVEVGLDTNARKNRGGFLMQEVIENYLAKIKAENKHFDFISEANKEKIYARWGVNIDFDKTNRRFDFVLLNKQNKKTILMEVNYYSSPGSKLKATAGEYKSLNLFLKKQDVIFVWITDGHGWNSTIRALRETFNKNDYVLNLQLIKDGAIEEIMNLDLHA